MTVAEVRKLIERWEAIDASLCRIKLNRLRDKITALEAENYSLTNTLNRAQKREQATRKVNIRFIKALIPISFVAILEAFYIIHSQLF